jgi:hypothetical protein
MRALRPSAKTPVTVPADLSDVTSSLSCCAVVSFEKKNLPTWQLTEL